MDEHTLQHNSDLQFSSSNVQGNFSYVPYLAENTSSKQHLVKTEDYDNYFLPQWIGYQHLAPNYVDYLLGNQICNMQGQISYESTGIGCSFTPTESFFGMDGHLAETYPYPQERDKPNRSAGAEPDSIGLGFSQTYSTQPNPCTPEILSRKQQDEMPGSSYNKTQHICYLVAQNQAPSTSYCHTQVSNEAVQYQPKMSALTSEIPTKSHKTYLRRKASESDRRRRTRIAAALDALDSLLPQSKEGNKTNVVDDCIDYIKYLQLHMRELSQNRLGGESTSNYLTYLEGYGHYLVHENTADGPLQDMLVKLFDENPSEASKFLESRDLFMMPISPN